MAPSSLSQLGGSAAHCSTYFGSTAARAQTACSVESRALAREASDPSSAMQAASASEEAIWAESGPSSVVRRSTLSR